MVRTAELKGEETMNQVRPGATSFAVKGKVLNSLQDAASSYGFQLLVPTAVPSGFQLQTILEFHSGPQVDNLAIRYTTADGLYLLITQGVPVGIEGTLQYVPDDHKGTVTVDGHPAYWVQGQVVPSQGDPRAPVFQPGSLRLSWNVGTAPGPHADAPIGYVLESDVLTRDQLISIGNSVQPYR
jgi:hypothetical protein